MKSWLPLVIVYSLLFIWYLVVLSFVVDPYLIYLVAANPKDVSQVPQFWKTIRGLSSLSRAALYLPFLILYPHSHRLTAQRNWLLHGIGIVSLVPCLIPLFVENWPKDSALGVLDTLGIISGRASVVYLGMLLLATSRRSALLNFHGFGYLDLIAFHKSAGWWCIAMGTIHSVAYLLFYLIEDGLQRVWSACFPTAQCFRDGVWKPCLNTLGLVNFAGVVGFVVGLILAVYSREHVRRTMYERFYVIHVVMGSLFVIFVALHDYATILLAFAGGAFYGHDRWVAWRSRTISSEVTAETICQSSSSNIVCLTWQATANQEFMPGSRWVYLRVEGKLAPEWHPFSIMQVRDRYHLLIKGLGDWSSSLCNLIASGENLRIQTEGPFGRAAHMLNKQSHALLLVAGGVGISPFVDLLCNASKDTLSWHKITLVWAVRRHEYDGFSAVIDLESLSCIAEISVYITSQESLVAPQICHQREITASFDSAPPPSAKLTKIRFCVAILVSCVIVTGLAWVNTRCYETLMGALYDNKSTSTLAGFTVYKRVAPLLIALLFIGLCSAFLLPVHKLKRAVSNSGSAFAGRVAFDTDEGMATTFASKPHLSQIYRPDLQPDPEPRAPQVYFSKPDLQQEMEREARLGPLDVQVCGPERMTASIVQAAQMLNSKGLQVELDIHDSAL